jgi:hypothetical protein
MTSLADLRNGAGAPGVTSPPMAVFPLWTFCAEQVIQELTRLGLAGLKHLNPVNGIDNRRDAKADAPLIGYHELNSSLFECGFSDVEFNWIGTLEDDNQFLI